MRVELFTVVVALVLGAHADKASAQDCSIALYADREGTKSTMAIDVDRVFGSGFTVYAVMFVQDTVNAVAYDLAITGYEDGTDWMHSVERDNSHPEGWWVAGPSGDGLLLEQAGGLSIGFGECASGFGGVPILVAVHHMYAAPLWGYGVGRLEPNLDQYPGFPAYGTCNHVLKPCEPGPDLVFESVLPSDATSVGAVKSLYH
jgi:hypothetical protein